MTHDATKRWLATVGTFAIMVALTLFVWRQQVEYQRTLITKHTEDVCVQASRRLEVFMESHLRVATIFARRWSTHELRDYSKQRFEKFASLLIEELPGFHAVLLIPPNLGPGWIVPAGTAPPDSLLDPRERRLLAESLKSGRTVVSEPFESAGGGTSILAAQPLLRDGDLLGFLVVDFLMKTLINDCFHTRIRSEFDFTIADDDHVLFRSTPETAIGSSRGALPQADRTFPVRNRTWRLSMTPRRQAYPPLGGTAHVLVLLLGGLVSVGLSWLVYLLLRRMELFRSARDQQALLSRKVLMAQEEERARVSRELHDELGQVLTALRLELGWLEKRIPATQESETGVLRNTVVLVEQATEELRRMCRGLRPPLLDDLGLEPAVMLLVTELQGRTDLDVSLESSMEEKNTHVSKEVALCTYRILQESLTNISRHAQASKVRISLATTPDALTLSVIDDGAGFDRSALGKLQGWGLEGMQERARLVGGSVDIQTARGKGTRIFFRAPLVHPDTEVVL
jgi:signal transduction histidine kinase